MNATKVAAMPEAEVERRAVLNEAASLLMQITPGDLRLLVELRGRLDVLAAAAEQPRWVREALGRAVEFLDAALMESHRLDPAVEEVGRLIEIAMYGADEALPLAPEAAAAPVPAASGSLPADTDWELLPDWTTESLEYLTAAEAALLALESDPTDVEAINTVFRGFHTIKGTAAFLGLGAVVELAHHAESLLSRVRDGEIAFTPACADLALRSADLLRELVHGVRGALAGEPFQLPEHYAAFIHALAAPDAGVRSSLAPRPLAAEPRAAEAEGADSSVRVRTDRLNQLMDLVGELVVAQAMIAQDGTVAGGQHHELARKVQQATKLVRELQGLSTAMRMVPLKATFQKLARLVRDVSRKVGKQVEFVSDGEETEIDRNMVAVIADPLIHMVRNAVDHGLESADERRASGKPATGRVRISAYHQGGSVVVELRDDGRGLSRETIVAKALDRGLIDTDSGLSDAEVYQLIFAPGFSTAEQVTDVSGRGVGMDVVRRNVETLHGRVDIAAEPGRGCTFTLRLPLTLAITDGMLVRVGGERYVVPTVHIYQNFRPDARMLSTVVGSGEVVLLHGEVIPLVRLYRVFAVAGAESDPTRATLMVVGDGSRRVALLVDEILGQQQFVAKPLGHGLGKVGGLAGGAVLGDGQVGLILDVAGVLGLALATPAQAVA